MLLLMAGGIVNEVWAKKITYHILTKPFTVRNYNNTGDYKINIRVEALQCTSEESTVGLPAQFKSPLATNFQYWENATSTYDFLYDYNHSGTKIISTKYDIYTSVSNEIAEGASADSYTDIYVTYDYNSSNDILDLTGETNYTVAINNSGTQKYMCYNRSRNNRIANALATGLSGEDLASDDFVTPVNDKKQLGWNWSKWGPIGIFLGFKFTGSDPYNFTIMTSYTGDELHPRSMPILCGLMPVTTSITNLHQASVMLVSGQQKNMQNARQHITEKLRMNDMTHGWDSTDMSHLR